MSKSLNPETLPDSNCVSVEIRFRVACQAKLAAAGPGFALRATPGRLRSASRAKPGGADRDRTDDLKLAKLALSQLSYGPGKKRSR